jgi:hypothetical protein
VTYRWARISFFRSMGPYFCLSRWGRRSCVSLWPQSLLFLSLILWLHSLTKGKIFKKTPPLSISLAPLWFSLRRRLVPGPWRPSGSPWPLELPPGSPPPPARWIQFTSPRVTPVSKRPVASSSSTLTRPPPPRPTSR